MRPFSIDEQRMEVLKLVFDVSDKFWMWTNKELAEEAGLSVSTVSRIRKNYEIDIRSSTLLKLCKAVELKIYLQHGSKKRSKAA